MEEVVNKLHNIRIHMTMMSVLCMQRSGLE